jgi:hypothetical protein
MFLSRAQVILPPGAALMIRLSSNFIFDAGEIFIGPVLLFVIEMNITR